MSNELEQRPEATPANIKDLMPVGERGVALRNLDDMYRFAQYLSMTRLTPKGLEQPAQILLAIQMGAELGLPPMASIQNIAVINGRPSIWGDAALAVCMEHPNYLDNDEDFDDATMTATCKIYTKKRGMDRPIVRTFSMTDAKQAQLQGKQGPWTQYPKRMLQLRARGFALRDSFPGALRGLLTTEEVRDLPPIQVENENEPTKTNKMDNLVQRKKAEVVLPEGMKGMPDPKPDPKPKGTPKPTPEPLEAEVVPVPEGEVTDPTQENASHGSVGGREPGEDDEMDPEPPFEADEAAQDDPDSGLSDDQNAKIIELKSWKKVGPKDFGRMLVGVGCEDAKIVSLTSAQAVELIKQLEAK